jgi:hypothetical protein
MGMCAWKERVAHTGVGWWGVGWGGATSHAPTIAAGAGGDWWTRLLGNYQTDRQTVPHPLRCARMFAARGWRRNPGFGGCLRVCMCMIVGVRSLMLVRDDCSHHIIQRASLVPFGNKSISIQSFTIQNGDREQLRMCALEEDGGWMETECLAATRGRKIVLGRARAALHVRS